MEFQLTPDQQGALEKLCTFLSDPSETAFIIEGYSGTGKSTLVKTFLDQLPAMQKTIRLINPAYRILDVGLTATTHKAAENFSMITGLPVTTIHSFLGLRVSTDHMTGDSQLVVSKNNAGPISGQLILIDEASYIDGQLLTLIFKRIIRCKVIFIGDPAQLVNYKIGKAPVFVAPFPKAKLEKVVRQVSEEGQPLHPITDLSAKFRHAVNTGEWFSFTPDGHHIRHVPRDVFVSEVLAEFSRPDWGHRDSKVLAWTNRRVIDYNHLVNDHVKGSTNFQVGEYAICNKFVTRDQGSIKTDQRVFITGISGSEERHGVLGRTMTLDHTKRFFYPDSMEAKCARLKLARELSEYAVAREIEESWIDLRYEFAQTVDKSQGSTYDRVFIDLDDINKCNSGNQIARMLYVGVSRARHHVVFTGDLV